jgi:glycosyltransferase involved in cell wall biosynthesis
MKIAIDCRGLCGPRTGGGQYTYHLVRELLKIDPKNTYFLCAHKEIVIPPEIQNNQNVQIKINRYPLGLIWQQFGVPLILSSLKADLFFSPFGTLPLFTTKKTVITILDLTSILMPDKHNWKLRLSVNSLIKSSAGKARKIITISDHTRKDVVKYLNIEEQKIISIPLGVASHFRPMDRQDRNITGIRKKYSNGEKFILYVGTIEPRKNLVFLIQVYQKLLARRPQMPKLLLAGGKGWKYNPVFEMVNSSAELKKNVIFAGYVPDEELPYVYNAAEMFVYPSLYEGFGLPPLEAMACGIPVITSNTSSLPEVVGQAGIMIDPLDAAAWKSAIYNLLEDEHLQRQMASNGIKQSQKFSWETTARKTLEIFEEIGGQNNT